MKLKKSWDKQENIRHGNRKNMISNDIQKKLQDIMNDDDTMFLQLWKYVFAQTKDKIEHNEMEYVAEGQEWVVYKIEIELPNKQKKIFLAVKKRFDNMLKEEIKLQKDFFEIAKKSKTGVQIPETLWEIDTNNGKYFLMEYIDGKTLFNLKMEKIAESFYNKFQKKYPDEFKRLKGINKNRDPKNINKANIFDFANDTEARSQIYKIIDFLNENFEPAIQKYTGTKGVALLDKSNYNKIIEKIYYDESLCAPIFNLKDGRDIQKKIKDFLHECHKKRLYHRDIWGNVSNIMFMYKNKTIIPVIIDFGKSIKTDEIDTKEEYPRWEWAYGDENETFLPDTDICEIIKWLSERPPTRNPGELRY